MGRNQDIRTSWKHKSTLLDNYLIQSFQGCFETTDISINNVSTLPSYYLMSIECHLRSIFRTSRSRIFIFSCGKLSSFKVGFLSTIPTVNLQLYAVILFFFSISVQRLTFRFFPFFYTLIEIHNYKP